VPEETPDVVELRTQLLQYRACLFDAGTRLPTLAAVLDQVRKMLEQGRVQVFLVRIEQEQSLESVVGWEQYDTLLRSLADYLREIVTTSRGTAGVVCLDSVRGDNFLVFTSDQREAGRLHGLLDSDLVVDDAETGESVSMALRSGQGRINRSPTQRVERSIYSGILQAQHEFERRGKALDEDRRGELRAMLRDRDVRTLFQPIYRLPQRNVVGYEALSRGPEGTYLETAENLFGFSERAGLLGEVEHLCVERALTNAHRLPLGATVFINLSMRGLEYLEATNGGLSHLVHREGWSPREFVLEITERTYAESAELLKDRVNALRGQGFRIAIDDMGTGYSSLAVLADLQPAYIKLDHMLVRDLASAPIKRNLVSAITGFAHSSQSLVIAEGVERQQEVKVLQEIGVFLVQGFYFGMPEAV